MLLNPDGSYIHNKFRSPKGTYILVGSKSNEDNDRIIQTIDTFKCNDQYFEWTRQQIANWYAAKKIWL